MKSCLLKIGKRNKNKPQAAFMFLGPSGVGKTEIAKALTEIMLNDERALTRFDMSEYMEKHAVAKLIGAPPGYEGFEAGGILTNAMRTNQNRILLFDEIEKAHPDVFNVFLQILSDGRLTDNIGRVVSFSESIIIMTTNIGQKYFLDDKLSAEDVKEFVSEELNSTYRPEFLNRFAGRENIINFKKLELVDIVKIVRRELNNLDNTYRESGIRINMSDEQLYNFCEKKYDPVVGARGLPGYIEANLEPMIVNMILSGEKVDEVNISFDREQFTLDSSFERKAA